MSDITVTSWLVVRRYHQKVRVLCMSFQEDIARTCFDKEKEELRDGTVQLYEVSSMKQIDSASGGYNRTRW